MFLASSYQLVLTSWQLMWSICILLFAGLKVLTLMSYHCRGSLRDPTLVRGANHDSDEQTISAWKHMAYLLAWPGMKPAEFFAKPSQGTLAAPAIHEWIFALGKFSIGLALLFIVAPASHGSHPLLIGWIGMLGAIMLLHFGLFHILSCVWRLCGLGARPIMNWPILACSLSEFWGQRWNLAFRDLTHQFVFRPTAKRWGATAALLISFVLSGLIHDLAISIPAGGGHGWPTAYFCLQAMGILIEKSALGKACRLSQGWCGRFYTAALLLLPITWLFHHHFVETVFVPFLEAIGATS